MNLTQTYLARPLKVSDITVNMQLRIIEDDRVFYTHIEAGDKVIVNKTMLREMCCGCSQRECIYRDNCFEVKNNLVKTYCCSLIFETLDGRKIIR